MEVTTANKMTEEEEYNANASRFYLQLEQLRKALNEDQREKDRATEASRVQSTQDNLKAIEPTRTELGEIWIC